MPRIMPVMPPSLAPILACLLLTPQVAGAAYSTANPVSVEFEMTATGLADNIGGTDQIFPTELVGFPDGSGRLLVGTLGGVVRLIGADGVVAATPYLDTTSSVTINADNGNSSFGLTTMAFHPDFATPAAFGFGKLYTIEPEITRSDPPADFPGAGTDQGGSNPAHDRVLYEYTVDDLAADEFSGTRREVLRIHEHRRGHDINDLVFDAGGYLYISSGDTVVSNTAQDLSNVFGKILRIDPIAPDVNTTSQDPVSANGSYRVPLANPFLADGNALDEIFAYGLRNPYRISIDSTSGALLCTSNGAGQRESLYLIDAGDNLGWPYFEGTRPAATPPPGFVFRPPVFEYDHGLGVSINGAFVYHGSAIPSLTGFVVFADFLGAGGSGARLFYGDLTSGDFFDILPDPAGAPLSPTIVSIGEDGHGELYLLGTDGTVLRMGGMLDVDADGIPDNLDNCITFANADQRDSNADGYGNACDPDLDDNGSVDFLDLGLMKAAFFGSDPDADLDGSGSVDFLDLAVMKQLFFGPPGPSGLVSQ